MGKKYIYTRTTVTRDSSEHDTQDIELTPADQPKSRILFFFGIIIIALLLIEGSLYLKRKSFERIKVSIADEQEEPIPQFYSYMPSYEFSAKPRASDFATR